MDWKALVMTVMKDKSWEWEALKLKLNLNVWIGMSDYRIPCDLSHLFAPCSPLMGGSKSQLLYIVNKRHKWPFRWLRFWWSADWDEGAASHWNRGSPISPRLGRSTKIARIFLIIFHAQNWYKPIWRPGSLHQPPTCLDWWQYCSGKSVHAVPV